MQLIDPRELHDLAALASRGGLGHGVALTDCVAEEPDQLMYIKGDELVLLRDLGSVLLASCEGVVGWVQRENVRFDSLASTSRPASPSLPSTDLPQTVLTAPSPPAASEPLPGTRTENTTTPKPQAILTTAPRLSKRESGPFELETPEPTPGIEQSRQRFASFQAAKAEEAKVEKAKTDNAKRDSVTSIASSALGGIGGFMMGGEASEEGHVAFGAADDSIEHLEGTYASETVTLWLTKALIADDPDFDFGSPIRSHRDLSFADSHRASTLSNQSDWDIYGDYARESMYVPSSSRGATAAKHASRASKAPSMAWRESGAWSSDGESGDFQAARAALERVAAKRLARGAEWDRDEDEGQVRDERKSAADPSGDEVAGIQQEFKVLETREARESDKVREDLSVTENHSVKGPHSGMETYSKPAEADENTESKPDAVVKLVLPEMSAIHTEDKVEPAQSVATPPPRPQRRRPLAMDLSKSVSDLRIDSTSSSPVVPETPKAKPSSPSQPTPAVEVPHGGRSLALQLQQRIHRAQESSALSSPITAESSAPGPTPLERTASNASSDEDTPKSSEMLHESETSTEIQTPHQPEQVVFTPSSPLQDSVDLPEISTTSDGSALLASPLSYDDVVPPKPPRSSSVSSAPASPHLVPPPPPNYSPSLSPNLANWSPNSPASPHSVAATKHAVEATRKTPEGKRPRGMTLVGRMDADLSAAKGPVPITFLLNGPGTPGVPPVPSHASIGLGMPHSLSGRKTPEQRRATSPLAPPLDPPFSDPMQELKTAPSPFPQMPKRSATNPTTPEPTHSGPKAGFFPMRPRSRSFSAAVSKAMGKTRKDPLLSINTASAPALAARSPQPTPTITPKGKRDPPLSINTTAPPVPSAPSPRTPATPKHVASASSAKPIPSSNPASPPKSRPTPSPINSKPASPSKLSRSSSSTAVPLPSPGALSNGSTPSLPLPSSARSSSFSLPTKGSKTPRNASRALPSPVSHKDFEDTVKAEGMDFELVQPRKASFLSAELERPSLERKDTTKSDVSGSSMGHLAETDEWGFLKDVGPTPEIFQSRSAAGDHRAAEQKWLSIISAPLPPGPAPKKVRKLVLDAGVPSSLRGKVWAWFMTAQMSARVPGLYAELLDHDKGIVHEQMERDVMAAFQDHSLFADPASPGQADLRNILRAFSNFAPCGYKPTMSLLAGALLIHCVAEDAFWLLSGLINGALRDYYPKEGNHGVRVDAAVFAGLLQGSEPKLAKLFKDTGVLPIGFLNKWFTQLFIRVLPWPTALRVVDGVVADGPRFLLVAALTVLTLSRDRLLGLPRNKQAILGYLYDLPQDSLLLPENFMKACENVKFRDDDLKRMRAAVEKDGLGMGA